MQDVLCKLTPRERYAKYPNFPTQFRLSLSLECSGENFTKIRQVCIPYKFGCIPAKIKCEILARKGS